MARREHSTSCRDPLRPVGEAVRRVVRSDDQARPNDRRAFAECVLHDRLADSLPRAVRVVARVVGIDELLQCGVLELRNALVGVDRDARDEDVAPHVRELPYRELDRAWEVRRDVDHDVPRPAIQRGHVPAAVAAKLLYRRKQVGIRLPAIEQRDLVTSCKRRLDHGASEEPRAPEDEDSLHPPALSSTKRTCVGVAPVFSPLCVCASNQRTSPSASETSRASPFSAMSRRSKEESVTMTLSGCSCGLVASPGSSRYSRTRTRSFSKTTLYLSGSVLVGSTSGSFRHGWQFVRATG